MVCMFIVCSLYKIVSAGRIAVSRVVRSILTVQNFRTKTILDASFVRNGASYPHKTASTIDERFCNTGVRLQIITQLKVSFVNNNPEPPKNKTAPRLNFVKYNQCLQSTSFASSACLALLVLFHFFQSSPPIMGVAHSILDTAGYHCIISAIAAGYRGKNDTLND